MATVDESGRLQLDRLNTIDEVAAFAKVGRNTVRRAIAAGDLEAVYPVPSRPRIPEGAVWAWLRARGGGDL